MKPTRNCSIVPTEKVSILRRHLIEAVPVSDLCDDMGFTRRCFTSGKRCFSSVARLHLCPSRTRQKTTGAKSGCLRSEVEPEA